MDTLEEIISSLPERQKEAFMLRIFSGLSYNEICEQLEMSLPMTKWNIYAARQQHKKSL